MRRPCYWFTMRNHAVPLLVNTILLYCEVRTWFAAPLIVSDAYGSTVTLFAPPELVLITQKILPLAVAAGGSETMIEPDAASARIVKSVETIVVEVVTDLKVPNDAALAAAVPAPSAMRLRSAIFAISRSHGERHPSGLTSLSNVAVSVHVMSDIRFYLLN
jgi:hypothetical protein